MKTLNLKVDSTSEKVLSKISAVQAKTYQELNNFNTNLTENYMTGESTRNLLDETLTE